MELELVYSGSFRFEKNHQKDASLLENDKNSSHSNRYKKQKKNWKGGIKNEEYKKNLTTKSDSNENRTHYHLFRKRALNDLAKSVVRDMVIIYS